MSDTLKVIMERWGFPTLVALAAGWMLRNDVMLPLVQQHSVFLQTVAESQKEISSAVREQTKLLYALMPEAQRRIAAQSDEDANGR